MRVGGANLGSSRLDSSKLESLRLRLDNSRLDSSRLDCQSLDSGLGMSPMSARFPSLSPVTSPLSINFPSLTPLPSPVSESFPDLRASCASLIERIEADKALASHRPSTAKQTRQKYGHHLLPGNFDTHGEEGAWIKRRSRTSIDVPQVLSRPEIESLAIQLNRRPSTGRSARLDQSRGRSEELHYAIERKDVNAVLDLLQSGEKLANPNAPRPGSPLTPLQRAFNVGSVPIAIYLVLAGARLEARSTKGETPLIRAVRQSFPDDLIGLMCELGADPDAVDDTGRSALHYAAERSPSDSTIMALVGHGADIDLLNEDEHTPLMEAVSCGRLSSARQLISCGADLKIAGVGGQTALGMAIVKRNTGIVKILCEGGAQVDQKTGESTPLLTAITAGCVDIAEALIEEGADTDLRGAKGSTPLLMAATLGNQHIVEALLKAGADPSKCSKSGNSPLHMAAQNGHSGILEVLAKAGAPLEAKNSADSTPLEVAVLAGRGEAVVALLAQGADVDRATSSVESLLWRALGQVRSSAGVLPARAEIAQLLIENGADFSRPEGNLELTPLHEAARLGLDQILVAMLSKGADVNATIWSGHTPLFFAAESGHLSTVRLLIKEHSADIHAQNQIGDTMLCAATGQPEILRYLLALKAHGKKRLAILAARPAFDVNQQNNEGATVLHYAALTGSYEGVRILLRKGAKPLLAKAVYDNLEDYRGNHSYLQGTPAGIARQKGYIKVAELLESWKYK